MDKESQFIMNTQKEQFQKVIGFPIIWCGALIGKRGTYAKKVNTMFRIGYHVNKNFTKNTAEILFRGKRENVEEAVSYVTKEVEQWEYHRAKATQYQEEEKIQPQESMEFITDEFPPLPVSNECEWAGTTPVRPVIKENINKEFELVLPQNEKKITQKMEEIPIKKITISTENTMQDVYAERTILIQGLNTSITSDQMKEAMDTLHPGVEKVIVIHGTNKNTCYVEYVSKNLAEYVYSALIKNGVKFTPDGETSEPVKVYLC